MSSMEELEAAKALLDAQVAADKAMGLGISKELAFAWWDAAVTLRYAKEAANRRPTH